tara:strand:+ start:2399 stop:3295 length:897 start_codon:yes stop_codon:yes gene_type:complete
MLEEGTNMSAIFHLAGIIPVAGQPLDFNFPWHDSCIPIASDYLAIERAVVECAYAGCETIWIVCHDNMQPLIRHRIGEMIEDPVWLGRNMDPRPSETRKQIPIYYVPIHPKDRDKRDCLGWSVLYGALVAYSTSKKISTYVIPNRYYTAFPYGVYPPEILRTHRKQISSDRPFVLSFLDSTIKDGEYLGFTFDAEDFKLCRAKLRKEGTGRFVPGVGMTEKLLPIEKRWSARHFPLEQVFSSLVLDGGLNVEVDWYFKIDSWDDYCEYMGSEMRKGIKRPSKAMLKYKEWNPVGEDNG